MLLMLGLLLAAVFLATAFLRKMLNAKYEQQNTSSQIKIIEKRPLSQRTTLYILEIDKKTLLIAETPSSVVALSESPLAN